MVREDGTISATASASLTETDALRIVPGGVWPLDPCATAATENGKVATIVKFPITDRVADAPAVALAIVSAISSTDPLVGFLPPERSNRIAVLGPNYLLEVVDHNRLTVLGVGPAQHESVGELTTHWTRISDVVRTGGM